jgi:hypothetical protein
MYGYPVTCALLMKIISQDFVLLNVTTHELQEQILITGEEFKVRS